MIACEDGPGDVLFLVRQRLGQGFAGRLIDCFQCVSIWISVPALFIHASWTERIVMWMGFRARPVFSKESANRVRWMPKISEE